jgi:type IV secretory pathway VirB6-like protein
MLTNGGQSVQAGTYWNLSNGSRVEMKQEDVLPGSGTARYIKAPAAVMLMAAPVIGLVFAVFLPFIGIVMTLSMAGRKLAQGVQSAAAGSMSFGWRPVQAYLVGRKAKKAARARKENAGGDKQR